MQRKALLQSAVNLFFTICMRFMRANADLMRLEPVIIIYCPFELHMHSTWIPFGYEHLRLRYKSVRRETSVVGMNVTG